MILACLKKLLRPLKWRQGPLLLKVVDGLLIRFLALLSLHEGHGDILILFSQLVVLLLGMAVQF